MKNEFILNIIVTDDGSDIGSRCNGKTIDKIIQQMEARNKETDNN